MNYISFENHMDKVIDNNCFMENLLLYLVMHEDRLKKNKFNVSDIHQRLLSEYSTGQKREILSLVKTAYENRLKELRKLSGF